MGNVKVKVLYVAALGRSGSTILSNILGQLDGYVSVGELRHIWYDGLIENRLCGCGVRFRDCEMWTAVFHDAFGGIDDIYAQEMFRLSQHVRTRHLPLMSLPQGQRLFASHLRTYLGGLEKLYRAIRSTTGSQVIVDSSKAPSYGYALGLIPAIDLYVVHLVRDSRAVAYSWLRRKLRADTPTPVYLPRHSAVKSAVLWDVWNMSIEKLWRYVPGRYVRLRYEDFVDHPQVSVERVSSLLDEKSLRLPFLVGRDVKIAVSHTVSGNPVRFRTGLQELRLDREWESEMKESDKTLVTVLTRPLLTRYGYTGDVDR